MCSDMTDAILESYPHPKKSLFEDAGVETDEEAGVKIPQNWRDFFWKPQLDTLEKVSIINFGKKKF